METKLWHSRIKSCRELTRIKEMEYDVDLIVKGIPKERILPYGFTFREKEVFIGSD